MTRRNFFRSALACFGAMVLAPVRAVEPRVPLIGNWDGKVRESPFHVLHWGPYPCRPSISCSPRELLELHRATNAVYLKLLAAKPPV